MLPDIVVGPVLRALKGGVHPESKRSFPENELKVPLARMVTSPLSGRVSPPHPTFFDGAT
jgi:hypothetical protein